MGHSSDEKRAMQIAQYAMWVSITSTCVSASRWIDETLEIRFTDGRFYAYTGVPVSIYEDFLASGSKGGFLNSTIKPNYS